MWYWDKMDNLDYLMNKLKQKGIDDAVLTFSTNTSRQIKFADNKIVKTGVEELSNIGIFVVKDKKILTTSCQDLIGEEGLSKMNDGLTELNKKNIDKLIEKIFESLKLMQPKKDYYGINEKRFKYKEVRDGYDSKVVDVDLTLYTTLDATNDAVCAELRIEPINARNVAGTALVDDVEFTEGSSNSAECTV